LRRSASPHISRAIIDLKLKPYAHHRQTAEGDVKGDRPVSWTLLMEPNMTLGPNLKVMREEGAMKAYIKLVSALRANDAAGRSAEAEAQER